MVCNVCGCKLLCVSVFLQCVRMKGLRLCFSGVYGLYTVLSTSVPCVCVRCACVCVCVCVCVCAVYMQVCARSAQYDFRSTISTHRYHGNES